MTMEIQPFEHVNFLCPMYWYWEFSIVIPQKMSSQDGWIFWKKNNKYLEHCVFGSPRFRSVSLGDPTDTARWERP